MTEFPSVLFAITEEQAFKGSTSAILKCFLPFLYTFMHILLPVSDPAFHCLCFSYTFLMDPWSFVSMANILIFSSICCYYSFLAGSPFRESFFHIPHKSKSFIPPLNTTIPQVSDLCPFFCLCILLSIFTHLLFRLPNLSSSLPRSCS